jgi:hypothetical protein
MNTKPVVQVGTALPLSCSAPGATVKDLFVLTSSSGWLLYYCSAANVWTLYDTTGTGSSLPTSCASPRDFFILTGAATPTLYVCVGNVFVPPLTGNALTVMSGTATIGAHETISFSAGTGISQTISDTGSAIDVVTALDSAYAATVPATQAGLSDVTDTGSNGSAYSGCPADIIGVLRDGMSITLTPAHSATGGATTFNLCTLGALPVYGWGGNSPSAGDLLAGRPAALRYAAGLNTPNGAWVFTPDGNVPSGASGELAPLFSTYGSRPACDLAATGQIFHASDISNKHWECDGSAWQPVAFDMQVAEPTTLTWSAAGSSTTPTISSVAGTLVVSATAVGTWQVAATPISLSTPYTIEVAFTFSAQFSSTTDGCGLVLFSSTPPAFSGPTWMAWFVGSKPSEGNFLPPWQLAFFDEWADLLGSYAGQQAAPVVREKLVDDGTNRTLYLNNGAGYFQAFQQSDAANNTPHNPGYWGVGCGVGVSGESSQLVLYSASVHH